MKSFEQEEGAGGCFTSEYNAATNLFISYYSSPDRNKGEGATTKTPIPTANLTPDAAWTLINRAANMFTKSPRLYDDQTCGWA